MMTCPNCKRTIKAIESVNGVTGEVSVNFCPGCGAMMPGTNYEQDNASCLQLCQSLFGNEWRTMIRAMPLLIARESDSITFAQLCEALYIPLIAGEPTFQRLDRIRDKATKAGVKLARGEE